RRSSKRWRRGASSTDAELPGREPGNEGENDRAATWVDDDETFERLDSAGGEVRFLETGAIGRLPNPPLRNGSLPPGYLQADSVAVDLARPEGRLPDHSPEVFLRVGPLAERTQNPSGHKRLEPPQPHFVYSGLDRLARCVLPQVVNHGLATRPQHSVH